MNQQEQLEFNLHKLDKYGRLPYNWNGKNGLSFPHSLISRCKEFISHLPYQPNISPTGRQTIYIEYKQPNGDILAFEYGMHKLVCAYVPAKKKKFGSAPKPQQYDATDVAPEVIYQAVRKFCNFE